MLVVAIVGTLAAIAVLSGLKAYTEAGIYKANADLRVIASAVAQLAFDTGKWPGGIPADVDNDPEVWDLNTPAAGLLASDGRFERWKGPYIRKIPQDPWGSIYFFDPDYLIKGKYYPVVGSYGPNKKGPNLYDSDDIVYLLK
jgi:type II secretory pathway pseudopilin PulG